MERRTLFAIILLFLLVATAAGTSLAIMRYEPRPAVSPPSELKLADTRAQAAAAASVPRWMPALIGIFTLVQIAPLAIAVGRTREGSPVDVREVNFLCEVPMYLGLLGSLLGVSLTQFFSGTVAAPLAYLTTISGIILFLLGKYMVALPYERKRKSPGSAGLL